MYKTLPVLLVTILIASSAKYSHANWFDDGLALFSRAANYTRHNPRVVLQTGAFVATASCVAYLVYKSRTLPGNARALEDGDWELVPVYKPEPIVRRAQPSLPPPTRTPVSELVRGRSPELQELILDVFSRRNRISGLNSEVSEN